MKKKQRCFVKRFAALVAALVICASLCVPAFASNNAQWRKWVITADSQMTNESGSMSKYFQLTPFQNGEIYAAVFQSYNGRFHYNSASVDGTVSWSRDMYFINCYNYPDWWRSAIPLGAVSYVQLDVKTLGSSSTPFPNSLTSVSAASVYFFDSNNRLNVSVSVPESSTSYSLSPGSISAAVSPDIYFMGSAESAGSGSVASAPSSLFVNKGQSYIVNLSNMSNVSLGWPFYSNVTQGVGFSNVYLTNLSSDRLVIGVSCGDNVYSHMTAELSFWVDANKLPAGLQVGDEFPADTDAFDQLRDELLDQFPEASDNIQSGKSTIQGWNDTETVDSDVASTSISALNAMFQNLGSFLFIISLMVFGAVVLRMFLKKAVDG